VQREKHLDPSCSQLPQDGISVVVDVVVVVVVVTVVVVVAGVVVVVGSHVLVASFSHTYCNDLPQATLSQVPSGLIFTQS